MGDEPFLGEIKIISWNFPPKGWAFCNGQLLAINQNQALFSILGTTYGGDGRVNFGLPNLQEKAPLHFGNGFSLGQTGGEKTHSLVIGELPGHTHPVKASANAADQGSPAGNLWANSGELNYAATPNTSMNPASVASIGGGQPHQNESPYLVLNFIIALVGIFPSQN
ncbi:MAG TPA: tail fiber protein [Acidimicrobiales bacterium]|jgi:microcystin-dependent protein|nr:tail fiber protein [Acidimicrobiales bacterium]